MQEMQARVLMKIDTVENWAAATNFIPLNGEICIYSNKTNTGLTDQEGKEIFIPGIKIGNGISFVNDLPFFTTNSITKEQIDSICD